MSKKRTKKHPRGISRRTLFRGALAAGVTAAVGRTAKIFAAEPTPVRFVHLYFHGGWDVLLGLDPRVRSREYSGIDLGTDFLVSDFRADLDPVSIGSQSVQLGPALRPIIENELHPFMTVFRGINMNTVAHPTAQSYINTFRAPAGTSARGSSIGTALASVGAVESSLVLPNVSIAVPSYNVDYPEAFTATGMTSANQVRPLLVAPPALSDDTERLLRAAQDASESCIHERYLGARIDEGLAESRRATRLLLEEDASELFNLGENEDLVERYGLTDAVLRNANHPSYVAAVAAQLIKSGISRSVTARIQIGMDTHRNDWGQNQGPRQLLGWAAIADLVADLREDDPNLENTIVLVTSEFARTPRINGNRGRDHWFANSVGVIGGKMRKGVFGATRLETLELQEIDRDTGEAAEGGMILTPEHVGATIAASAGLDASVFREEPLAAWTGVEE